MVSANREMAVYCFDTLVSHYNSGQPPPPAFDEAEHPLFVTWKKAVNGSEPRLRGCIGTLEARYLINGFRDYALTSALRDRRFPPIQAKELPHLECTVSILTNYESALHYLDWEVGKHGLIIEFTDPDYNTRCSATYLPEVAAHEVWLLSVLVEDIVNCQTAMSEAENTKGTERMILAANVESLNSTTDPSEVRRNLNNENGSNVSKVDKKRKYEESSADDNVQDTGNRKPSKPRSWTWDHFIKDSSTSQRARCKWCGATYACDSHRNGTSNLKNHLLNQCKKFPKESLDANQKTLALQHLKKEEGKGIGNAFVAVSFDVEACRQALARMIMVDELPFKFVEGEGFRQFMSVVQPKLSIPGRITIARDCWTLYMNEKNKLKSMFRQSNQSVCLTTDCWTSVQNMNYLCLTAHFIDQEWKLQKRILNFCLIKNHKGETIGRKIEKCLLGWLIARVFTITVDNASSNDVAISYLKNRMEDWNSHPLKGEYMHVRCCAHILNLVVNDGLKDMHSSISKIRNAIRYVRASPGRMDRFKKCIKEARLQENCYVQLDVPTRWNSTYIMLESALKFQKAFKRLSERDAEFVLMQGGIPLNDDWDNAKCFVKFLKNFYDATMKVSGSTFVTSSQYFHDYCLIINTLKTWVGSNDRLLGSMAEKMKAKHDKYWGSIKNTNMMIFIAVILDPRYKFRFLQWSFERLYEKDDADFLSEKVKDTFNNMFDSYKLFFNHGHLENSAQFPSEVEMASFGASDNTSFAMEFEKDMNQSESMTKNEVDLYLMEGLEKTNNSFDILNWWKVNSTKFPILGQIARDVLAMPVSTVASESAFSIGGRVLNSYRSSLTPKTVEALICAQNWFRSTPMSYDIEEHLEEFEKLELELAPIPQQNEEDSDAESD